MTEIHMTERYVWVYINVDRKTSEVELTSFVSPDKHGEHLDTIATPFYYRLVRNGVRYNVSCQIQLSEKTAIRIAGTLYDAEFEIAPQMRMKVRR
jgi:hypothetical protein